MNIHGAADKMKALFLSGMTTSMLKLADIPFFNALSPHTLAHLQATIPVRHYKQGSVIARAGDKGQFFQAIAEGAVWVQQADRYHRKSGIVLGPGQVFGEMSLFSGMPISATLVASKNTKTFCFNSNQFLHLLESVPQLHVNLTNLLIERLRRRTHHEGYAPNLVVLAYETESTLSQKLVERIIDGIHHYSAGSRLFSGLQNPISDAADPELHSKFNAWRESAPNGQLLVLRVRPAELPHLSRYFEPKDVVLHIIDTTTNYIEHFNSADQVGVADFARVYLGERDQTYCDLQPWAYQLMPAALEKSSTSPNSWQEPFNSTLDKIARYLTFKEVGIAMSSGAALGFAHLGVLDAMAQCGINYDVLCGSSMGGIVALTVAHLGSIDQAIQQVREQLGSNRKIKDPSLLPRGSLFIGNKIAAAAKATFGDCTFADLKHPAAVVAADLVTHERIIFDRGLVAPAVLATSAIPGFFPPVANQSRLMVDGSVVSLVPVDVLSNRRCGLRIAINVNTKPFASGNDVITGFDGLLQKTQKPLGLKDVLSASWGLLGSWRSSSEALRAEIVINPQTPVESGYNFNEFEKLVDCGRTAMHDRIESIQESIKLMLRA